MILSRISDYLRMRGRASVSDMELALGATPEALRDMLSVLERKGRARRLPSGTSCGGGCSKCDPASIELYEATEPEAKAATLAGPNSTTS